MLIGLSNSLVFLESEEKGGIIKENHRLTKRINELLSL